MELMTDVIVVRVVYGVGYFVVTCSRYWQFAYFQLYHSHHLKHWIIVITSTFVLIVPRYDWSLKLKTLMACYQKMSLLLTLSLIPVLTLAVTRAVKMIMMQMTTSLDCS